MKGSKYSKQQQEEAVMHYMVLGSTEKVAEITSIPSRTVRGWTKQEWWHDLIANLRQQKDAEFDAMATNIIHKAGEELKDRLEFGDFVLGKDGELKRKPISGRDLVIIQGTEYDKRQLGRNMPTSIKAQSSDSQLQALADKISVLGNAIKPPIEAERVEDEE